MVQGADGAEYFKFLYAVQSPVYLALSPVAVIERHREPVQEPVGWGSIEALDQVVCRFHCNYAHCSSGEELLGVEVEQVSVIPFTKYIGGMVIESEWHSEPLQQFLRYLPNEPKEETEPKKRKVKDNHSEALRKAFLWLTVLDEKEGFTGGPATAASSATSATGDGPSGSADAYPDGEDIDAVQVMQALDSARSALARESTESWDDFGVTVLGGMGLMATDGIPFDAVCGICKGQHIVQWCRRRGVQYSFRANYSTYGTRVCGILCRAWSHRMQYYYNLQVTSPEGDALVFTEEHHAGYTEPTELTRLLEEPEGSRGQIRARVTALRALFR